MIVQDWYDQWLCHIFCVLLRLHPGPAGRAATWPPPAPPCARWRRAGSCRSSPRGRSARPRGGRSARGSPAPRSSPCTPGCRSSRPTSGARRRPAASGRPSAPRRRPGWSTGRRSTCRTSGGTGAPRRRTIEAATGRLMDAIRDAARPVARGRGRGLRGGRCESAGSASMAAAPMDEDLRAVLAGFPAAARPLTAPEPLGNAGGTSGARLWRFASGRGILVARAWPPDGPGPADLEQIHGWLAEAEGLGFVPVPVPGLDGRTVRSPGRAALGARPVAARGGRRGPAAGPGPAPRGLRGPGRVPPGPGPARRPGAEPRPGPARREIEDLLGGGFDVLERALDRAPASDPRRSRPGAGWPWPGGWPRPSAPRSAARRGASWRCSPACATPAPTTSSSRGIA